MKFMQTLRKMARSANESLGPMGQKLSLGIGKSIPPKRGTADYLKAYGEMPWLRSVTSKKAYGMATLKWSVESVRNSAGKTTALPHVAKMFGQEHRRKALAQLNVERHDEHPLPGLLANPCPMFPALDASMLWQLYLDIAGEAFHIIETQGTMPVALYPIPPTWVTETPTKARPFFKVEFEGYREEIPAANILWDRDLDPFFPYGRGTGLMRTLSDELDASESAARLVNYQFFNMNRPDLLVTVDGMDQLKLDAFKDAWTGAFQGIRKHFRTFFHNKTVTVERIQDDFVHSQLGDMQKYLRDVIHQVPGIPPEILGILDSSNKATITAAEYIFGKHVLEQAAEKRRSFLQHQLVPMFDERIILEYESPVPRDEVQQLAAMVQAPVGPTVNDWRKMCGLPELDGEEGNAFVIKPGTVQLVSSLADMVDAEPAAALPSDGQFQYEGEALPEGEPPPEEPEPEEEPEQLAASYSPPSLDLDDLSPDGKALLKRATAARMEPEMIARLLCILHEKDTGWSDRKMGEVDETDYQMIDSLVGPDWRQLALFGTER